MKRLSVLLLFPPARQGVRSLFLQTAGSGIGHKPPLGILLIAAYLKAHSGHTVTLWDLDTQEQSEVDLAANLKALKPDVVGISAWTDFWYPVTAVLGIVKNVLPQVHCVVGGPHAGVFPRETLTNALVDSVVLGDGEVPFLNLLNHLAGGEPLLPRGVYCKADGVPEKFECFTQENLDELAPPDRSMLPLRGYTSLLARRRTITTMITSRGCPFHCIYCKLDFQKPHLRSASLVVEEMAQIRALGIREIEIYDDTFTWSKQRLTDICEELIRCKLGLEWSVRDRVTMADPQMYALMRRAGCRRIHLGIESGNAVVLERIKKKITPDQALSAVRAAKKAGLKVLAYYLFGLPGEGRKEIEETIRFALALDTNYAEFNIAIPYPGTQMYQDGLSRGIFTGDYWAEFAVAPTPDFTVPRLYEEFLSRAELVEFRNRATRQFYFRPKVLVRELLGCRTLGEFGKKAAMGLNLLRQAR
ncbi:MAG: radical SAM protein [Chitinivibrionales bacterium]|nr:radical SAM protein [Chitinivibrionales bacterium]